MITLLEGAFRAEKGMFIFVRLEVKHLKKIYCHKISLKLFLPNTETVKATARPAMGRVEELRLSLRGKPTLESTVLASSFHAMSTQASDLTIWPAPWIIKLIYRQGIKLWGEKKYMWKSSHVAKTLGLELCEQGILNLGLAYDKPYKFFSALQLAFNRCSLSKVCKS